MRLFLCIIISCFVLTSTANAAMICCWSQDSAAQEMQMDQGTDKMPCHEMSEDQKNAESSQDDMQGHMCNDCDCKSCSKVTAIQPHATKHYHEHIINRSFDVIGLMSTIPDGIFYPPKHIS